MHSGRFVIVPEAEIAGRATVNFIRVGLGRRSPSSSTTKLEGRPDYARNPGHAKPTLSTTRLSLQAQKSNKHRGASAFPVRPTPSTRQQTRSNAMT